MGKQPQKTVRPFALRRLVMHVSIPYLFLLALVLFAPTASAHWGGGDGHIAAAIAEWSIILGSLITVFVLAFRKKPDNGGDGKDENGAVNVGGTPQEDV